MLTLLMLPANLLAQAKTLYAVTRDDASAAEAVVDGLAEAEKLHSETVQRFSLRQSELSEKLARRLLDEGNTED